MASPIYFYCADGREINSGRGCFPGNLGAFLARLGKPDCDRLFAACYSSTFSALARSKRSALLAVHGSLHACAGGLTVSCHHRLLVWIFSEPESYIDDLALLAASSARKEEANSSTCFSATSRAMP